MTDAPDLTSAGPPRVYLHVGVPKTGTTFIQDVLWRGRDRLARDGVCYPLEKRTEVFAAAMDLRGASWGGRRNPAWAGTWDRLAATVRASAAHTSVLSSELLAAADRAAVERAIGSFPDHEVHIVVTTRDLARQLVSGWQEQVKHRVSVPLDEFVAACLDVPGAGRHRLAERFWSLHDVADVVARWRGELPVAQVHLVTVPPDGGPKEQLWQRFGAVTGIDAGLGRVDPARPNRSLRAADAELLRRYNAEHAGDVSPQHYDQLVRVQVAEKALTGAAGDTSAVGGAPLVLPPRFAEAVHIRAVDMAGRLAAGGYDVVGDLADLVPEVAVLQAATPQVADDDQLADAAVRAVAGLVAQLGPMERRLGATGQGPDEAERRRGRTWRRRISAAPGSPRGNDVHPGPVYLHVGAPKTGTTFLQDVMWQHREQLADAGVLFARRAYADHFQATVDLRGVRSRNASTSGAWDRVVADTSVWAGTSIISHELFAAATPEHVARAMASLGPERVHVVYSVRDLWRLLAAEWQEATKHGRELSFDAYLSDVLDQGSDGMIGRWFWSVHDPVAVLRRWGADLPRERVHVVTVPPAGTAPTLLWERFAALVGVDPSAVDTSVARPNTSLGPQEVTFLRRVNHELGGARSGRLGAGEHSRFVKNLLAQDVLAARNGKTRYAPPAARFDQVRARADEFVAGLRAAGYHVVGDLAELVPDEPATAGRHPDETTSPELVDVGLDALAGLVRHAAGLREAAAGTDPGAVVHPPSPPSRVGRLLRRTGGAVRRRVAKTPEEDRGR